MAMPYKSMKAKRLIKQACQTFNLFALLAALPLTATADHVPDTLAQDLNPNYIACLAAVDDADRQFRDALQSTCLRRLGDICSGETGTAEPHQLITCLHVENRRGLTFVTAAAKVLPPSTHKTGFFGQGYQRHRATFLTDIASLQNAPAPVTVQDAMDQTVKMALAATTLFWLARETDTSLTAEVATSFGEH